MEFIEVKLTDLKPADYNPRKEVKKGSKLYKSIEKSITEFGYADPIIINDDLTVIGGHQRLIVLKDMGVESEKVIKLKLDKHKEKALNLALNKIGGFWDEDKLKEVFQELEYKIDFESTGFTENEIKKYLGNTEISENESAGSSKKHDIKIGDVFKIGKHYLMCGDCTNQDHVNKLLNDIKVDALITDPPYGVDYASKTKYLREALNRGRTEEEGFIENDKNKNYIEFFQAFLDKIPFAEYNTAYIFMQGVKIHDLHTAFLQAGGTWGDYLIWLKQHAIMGRKDYNIKNEFIFYGWFGKHKFHGPINAVNVFDFEHAFVNELHPHQKPLDLMGCIIEHATVPKGIIYDPFGGSGTTLIAAEKLERVCYMMELSPDNCDVIINRAVNSGLVVNNGR